MGPTAVKTNDAVAPEMSEEPLYDPSLLAQLNWTKVKHMKDGVTSHTPGEGFRVRPLCKADFDRGYLDLLKQLTKVGDISRKQFEARFDEMQACPGHYYVTVVEDLNKGKIIGAATLQVELKFIRECAKRGRLEDVVVDDSYRGKQLGKLIVTTITLMANYIGCYKIGLDCNDGMRTFYRNVGYDNEKGNDTSMMIRF